MVAAIPGYYSKNLCGQKAFKLVLLKVILLSRDLRFVNYRERKSPPLRWEGLEWRLTSSSCRGHIPAFLCISAGFSPILICYLTLFLFQLFLALQQLPPKFLASDTNHCLVSLRSLGRVGSAEQFFCFAWCWLGLQLSRGSYELEYSSGLSHRAGGGCWLQDGSSANIPTGTPHISSM